MCDICRQYPCHPRCPNADPYIPDVECTICNKGIFPGEFYIKNDKNEYAHWECMEFCDEVVEFLGYEVKEME